MNTFYVKRGDFCWVRFGKGEGHKQGGLRPCIVVQNDIANLHSPTTIVVLVTSHLKRADLPCHVEFMRRNGTMNIALCEQITTIDKKFIMNVTEHLSDADMFNVDRALKASISNEGVKKYG